MPPRSRTLQSVKPDADGLQRQLTIGQLAARSGVAVSAIRFYEAQGLITGWRTVGNQRRYQRETLRRVAVIKVAQRLGIPLSAIRSSFMSLPRGRTPTVKDWAALSDSWRADLDDRIVRLKRLRDELTNCIGCGCLSLDSCPLYNPGDALAREGSGPRLLDARIRGGRGRSPQRSRSGRGR
jgi:MerR family transcriptional regulator, redox-sensitive transcriptional activator SoxR